MEINKKLFNLYNSKWNSLSDKLTELVDSDALVKPTNPLLLSIGNEENYLSADIRIMVFGQETNDWGGHFGGDINYIQSIYDEFFNTGRCFKYGGQFWNGIGRFISLAKQRYHDKNIEFVWNNVVKIGISNSKGMPPQHIYNVERELFTVLEQEVDILQPNLILFLSGPYYDILLKDQFSSISFEEITGIAIRQLARVKVPQVNEAFRTYHPNYLWRKNINHYYETILDQIKL